MGAWLETSASAGPLESFTIILYFSQNVFRDIKDYSRNLTNIPILHDTAGNASKDITLLYLEALELSLSLLLF